MIPTHKDLIQKKWKQRKNDFKEYVLFSKMDIEIGVIIHMGNLVTVVAKLEGKLARLKVVDCKEAFTHHKYIPVWEELMNELLKDIFI